MRSGDGCGTVHARPAVNRKILFILATVLVVELAGLVFAGTYVGFAVVIWYALLTVILGISVARKEGTQLGQAWQRAVGSGKVPDKRFFGGVMLVGAGILLAIPGLISDVFAIALLIPPVRNMVASKVQNKLAKQVQGMMANPAAFMSQFGDMAARAQAQAQAQGRGGAPANPLAGMFGGGWAGGANKPGNSRLGGTGQVIDTQATTTDSKKS